MQKNPVPSSDGWACPERMVKRDKAWGREKYPLPYVFVRIVLTDDWVPLCNVHTEKTKGREAAHEDNFL